MDYGQAGHRKDSGATGAFAWWRVRAWLVRIALTIFSLTFCAFSLEIAVRGLAPQPLEFFQIKQLATGQAIDGVPGPESDPAVIDEYLSDHGLGGGRIGERVRTQGIVIETNSRGWRDQEAESPRPATGIRVAVIGDSVVKGHGVELADTFHKRAQLALWQACPEQSIEVLGFGRSGRNFYWIERIAPAILQFYRPDILIIAANLNDVVPRPVLTEGRQASFTATLVRLYQTRIDLPLRSRSHAYVFVRDRLRRIAFSNGMAPDELAALGSLDPDAPASQIAWRDSFGALDGIADTARRAGAVPFLLLLPGEPQLGAEYATLWREQYRLGFSDSFAHGRPQEILANWAEGRKVSVIDPRPALVTVAQDKSDALFFREVGGVSDWNHPTARGHAIIGDVVAASLLQAIRRNPALARQCGTAR